MQTSFTASVSSFGATANLSTPLHSSRRDAPLGQVSDESNFFWPSALGAVFVTWLWQQRTWFPQSCDFSAVLYVSKYTILRSFKSTAPQLTSCTECCLVKKSTPEHNLDNIGGALDPIAALDAAGSKGPYCQLSSKSDKVPRHHPRRSVTMMR